MNIKKFISLIKKIMKKSLIDYYSKSANLRSIQITVTKTSSSITKNKRISYHQSVYYRITWKKIGTD